MESPRVLRSVCVYAGASGGALPEYEAAAVALGRALARQGLKLVYGGGNIGLMGALAGACAAEGGEVLGIIPKALASREVSGTTVGKCVVVNNMHERKKMMADEADAFVALPGGFGTVDELQEAICWNQLGVHSKPVGVLDVAGFYKPLLAFYDHLVSQGFVKPEQRACVVSASDAESLLALLLGHELPKGLVDNGKWAEAGSPSMPAEESAS